MIIADYPSPPGIQRRYELLKLALDERLRRLWAAAEALTLGEGGVSIVAGVTGLSRTTIRSGIDELQGSESELVRLTGEGRVRKRGAGRKSVVERDRTLEADLAALLESSQEEEGRPLDWTCKSIRGVTAELVALGHQVSYRTIGKQLHSMGYRFSPADTYKKVSVVARREQYRWISRRTAQFLVSGDPVISLGIADEASRQLLSPDSKGVGLAVSLLRYWWQSGGERRPTRLRRILLLLDTSGLGTGDRATWAPLLLPLAAEAGLEIEVSHFPAGARRWQRSASKISFSLSLPGQFGEALAIELDLIQAPQGEPPPWAGTSPGPAESVNYLWNYRISGQPKLLTE